MDTGSCLFAWLLDYVIIRPLYFSFLCLVCVCVRLFMLAAEKFKIAAIFSVGTELLYLGLKVIWTIGTFWVDFLVWGLSYCV